LKRIKSNEFCKDNQGEQINATQVILEGSGHDTAYSEIAQSSV